MTIAVFIRCKTEIRKMDWNSKFAWVIHLCAFRPTLKRQNSLRCNFSNSNPELTAIGRHSTWLCLLNRREKERKKTNWKFQTAPKTSLTYSPLDISFTHSVRSKNKQILHYRTAVYTSQNSNKILENSFYLTAQHSHSIPPGFLSRFTDGVSLDFVMRERVVAGLDLFWWFR